MVHDAYATSPDSQWVVYAADADGDGAVEIYSNRVGDSAATRLAGGLGSGVAPRRSSVRIAPDSRHVVFIGDTDAGQVAVYSTPITTSVVTNLSGVQDAEILEPLGVLPTGERVVYAVRHDNDIYGVIHLYASPIAHGDAVALAEAYLYGEQSFELGADGRVVYLSLDNSAGKRELHSVAAAGGTPMRLTPDVSVRRYQVTPSGDRVVFFYAGDLYIVDTEGGPVTRLTYDAGLDDATPFVVNKAESRLAISMSLGSESQLELRLVALDRGGHVSLMDSPIPPGAEVTSYVLRSGGNVAYLLAESERVTQLYRSEAPSMPPDLYVEKQVAPAETLAVGQVITYTLRFGNRGAVAVSGAVISDTLPATFIATQVMQSGTPATLVPGSRHRWESASLAPSASGVIMITGSFTATAESPPVFRVVNAVDIGAGVSEAVAVNNRSDVEVSVHTEPLPPSPTPPPPTPPPSEPTDYVYLPTVMRE